MASRHRVPAGADHAATERTATEAPASGSRQRPAADPSCSGRAFTQEELRRALTGRLSGVRPSGRTAPAVAVVLSFDPAGFARSLLDFAAALGPEAAQRWLGDCTRTLYLAGTPCNLAGRLPPTTLGADGQISWYAHTDGPRHRELRLLLRALRGELPAGLPHSFRTEVPGSPAADRPRKHWRMTVDVRGLSLPQYLVHVGHTLAESALTGTLGASDVITTVHTGRLSPPPGGPAYLRVHQDVAAGPSVLRAYACLAEETPHE